jgi:dTDP-4-dehydrorhamnose 3,5-epimerase
VDGPAIAGVSWVATARPTDRRGWFTKVFQASTIDAEGADPTVGEVYLSASSRGVVRGLHFQAPPHSHAKTVACVGGAILDVAVDLRRGGPSAGAVAAFRLDAEAPSRLHLPAGLAHGFQALTKEATVVYVVATEHAPDHDLGVRFDSVGVDWPIEPVILSDRDATFPTLRDLTSPFSWPEGTGAG